MTTKQFAYISIFALFLSVLVTACSDPEKKYEAGPSGGLVTYINEVAEDEFKIVDELTVTYPEESRIIATYLDGERDTLTVAMAAAMDTTARDTTKRQRVRRTAGHGYFYFMMFRNSWGRGHRPSPGAYANKSTYNRVNRFAGSSMTRSAKSRASANSRAKSGFGSGRSTRSSGG